ncbi:acyl-CoA dehydrogenase family protein [Enterobacter ludwigii]|uniref:acyl-CoA dehydrogenase family protein n=1 Tax=Enterobacter ludwigii TaxID=299767 RepID=UPI001C8CC395|nr:acyl-CoA dehydrogenase family protein [Enterobacter ludwigii]EES0032879.1 hypothetical protein [Escherichia coli]EKS6730694.1 acyl-CoA dehydrogenase family protein [Enterobacter mori]MBX8911070.1 hypothetical protein [Enterobacter ludwigii]MCM7781934.1 acyl-CoA dehydrogenase family protein [Enterobacter ludwigii]
MTQKWNASLTKVEDDITILENADRFARTIAASVSSWERKGALPAGVLDAFSATGLWALMVPKVFGGPGSSLATVAAVVARIS